MTIKLITFNIHKGLTWDNRYPIMQKLRSFLRHHDADIVFLQEVCGHSLSIKKKFGDKVSKKEWSEQFEYLADTIWPHFAYGKNAVLGESNHGNAILSKYPIVNWWNKDVTINRVERRGVLHAEIVRGQKKLHLYCVHFDLFHFSRKKQYNLIKDVFKSHDENESVIVGGDFNDWSRKASLTFEKELGFKDAYKTLHGDYAQTFPAFFPVLPLDRIYTRNVKVKKAKVIKDGLSEGYSDHLPVEIDFIWEN